MGLLLRESLVLLHFCSTVVTFVVAMVTNFGESVSPVPYVGIGSGLAFVALFAAHRPLDRLCGFND